MLATKPVALRSLWFCIFLRRREQIGFFLFFGFSVRQKSNDRIANIPGNECMSKGTLHGLSAFETMDYNDSGRPSL